MRTSVTTAAHCRYTVLYNGPEGLVIQDNNGDVSVTNDAENVVTELADLLGPRRLFYFDSMNLLDEIRIEAGRFAGFGPASDEVARLFGIAR